MLVFGFRINKGRGFFHITPVQTECSVVCSSQGCSFSGVTRLKLKPRATEEQLHGYFPENLEPLTALLVFSVTYSSPSIF